MKRFAILFVGILFFASCEKDPVENVSTVEMLCKQAWVLASAGFDDNQNGKIDDGENVITDCQKGNLYNFIADGTGGITDGGEVCTPPVNTAYSWKLSNNDQLLEIGHQPYSILKLGEDEMMIVADQPGLVSSFILAFHR